MLVMGIIHGKLFQDRLIAAAIFDGEICEKLVKMVFS